MATQFDRGSSLEQFCLYLLFVNLKAKFAALMFNIDGIIGCFVRDLGKGNIKLILVIKRSLLKCNAVRFLV